jgi:hypothetical protein
MRNCLLAAALLAMAAFLVLSAQAQDRGGKAKAGTSTTSTTGKGEVQFVGKKADGKFGALSQGEARDWLLSKVPGRANQIRSKASSCVSDILSDKGKATGSYKFQGAPILHVSNGAGNTGCTVFYVLKQSGRGEAKGGKTKATGGTSQGKGGTSSTSTTGKREVRSVKVVAIGHHVGPTTYELDWRDRGCRLPNRFNLSD